MNQSVPTYEEILESPYYSSWLKEALKSSLKRDVLDALKDSYLLFQILNQREMAMRNRSYEEFIQSEENQPSVA